MAAHTCCAAPGHSRRVLSPHRRGNDSRACLGDATHFAGSTDFLELQVQAGRVCGVSSEWSDSVPHRICDVSRSLVVVGSVQEPKPSMGHQSLDVWSIVCRGSAGDSGLVANLASGRCHAGRRVVRRGAGYCPVCVAR